ncbi:MAG: ribosomal protein L7/L12 [Clostridium sp.]|jgi:ribosomal protein L7/L12
MEFTIIIISILVGVVLLFALILLINKINSLEKNVTYMNLVLNRVAKQVGVPKPSLDDELRTLIALGKKIPAIKELRKSTELSLREAKDYVDKL